MALITREGKGSKLTIQEMDGNLTYLESLGLSGTQYVFVSANGTDLENAVELQAAYNLAKTMSPSITKRITVIAAPGNYNFGEAIFTMDTQYIDLVSLDGNISIILNYYDPMFGGGYIYITANNVFVKGVSTELNPFYIGNGLNLLRIENCKGGANSFGDGNEVSGTFIDCTGGEASFGGYGGIVSGTFIDCIAGNFSFGAFGTASGVFNNCVATSSSFGSFGIFSGTCTSCISDLYGTIAGKLYFCRQTTNGNALPVIAPNSAGKIVAFITKDNNFIAQQP